MFGHGLKLQRGMHCATDFKMAIDDVPVTRSQDPGRFGRLFPELDPADPNCNNCEYEPTDTEIRKISLLLQEQAGEPNDHPTMPSGFVFLGQFVDHDITFDPVTTFEQRVDPAGVRNFRTPNLDLDSLYGAGPDADRQMYDVSSVAQHQSPYRLLLDADRAHDLPRNSQGTAIIGDPRNDENLLVSQLHLAMIKFHNAVVQWLIDHDRVPRNLPLYNKRLFETARHWVVWHYQWILLHEFLPFLIGQPLVDDILNNGRRFYTPGSQNIEPFIPVEFGGGAYRVGHTLIREHYLVTWKLPAMALFDLPFFGLGRDVFDEQLEWPLFFDFDDGMHNPQKARLFDAKVADPLFNLPFVNPQQDPPISLPERNMQRARTLRITSGQKVARHMGVQVLSNQELGLGDLTLPHDEAPLWYYVLKEAEVLAAGLHLGPVGGRIVGEVLIGLLQDSAGNYLHDNPEWTPELPREDACTFTMVDLLRFAGA